MDHAIQFNKAGNKRKRNDYKDSQTLEQEQKEILE